MNIPNWVLNRNVALAINGGAITFACVSVYFTPEPGLNLLNGILIGANVVFVMENLNLISFRAKVHREVDQEFEGLRDGIQKQIDWARDERQKLLQLQKEFEAQLNAEAKKRAAEVVEDIKQDLTK